MRITLALFSLVLSTFLSAFAAAAPGCVSVSGDVSCDVAASGSGDADGAFVAVSGTGEATTYMDRCLEWICPSVAVSAYDDAHASCHASSVCVAIAGRGHATHDGIGVAVGGCDLAYAICYPVLAPAEVSPPDLRSGCGYLHWHDGDVKNGVLPGYHLHPCYEPTPL